LFIVTKIWVDEVEDVESACRMSLNNLQLDYIDLYLLHFPVYIKRTKEPVDGNLPEQEKIKLPVHKVWP
jgi:diketogulonate reductase-like aldo/keto reductase